MLGVFSSLLLLGALIFQYVLGYPPCAICHWQRWPHIAAAFLGFVGWGLWQGKYLTATWGLPLALLVLALVLFSAGLGAYHAGIEYGWWKGPSSCTGSLFHYTGRLDLNARIVLCDKAAWQFLGLSLAGYNALFSAAAGFCAAFALKRRST